MLSLDMLLPEFILNALARCKVRYFIDNHWTTFVTETENMAFLCTGTGTVRYKCVCTTNPYAYVLFWWETSSFISLWFLLFFALEYGFNQISYFMVMELIVTWRGSEKIYSWAIVLTYISTWLILSTPLHLMYICTHSGDLLFILEIWTYTVSSFTPKDI